MASGIPILLILMALAGCRDATELCSSESSIRNGSGSAGYLGLHESHEAAVTYIETSGAVVAGNFCSAVWVHPEWLLSAAHCFVENGSELVWVNSSSNELVQLGEYELIVHPTRDLVLLNAGQYLMSNSFLSWATFDLQTKRNTLVEIAGYGRTANGNERTRRFGVAEIESVSENLLTTTFSGLGGACAGDSGGPMLGRSDVGDVVILGILSQGPPSCGGGDQYERLDTVKNWLSNNISQVEVGGRPPCGTLGRAGRCFENRNGPHKLDSPISGFPAGYAAIDTALG